MSLIGLVGIIHVPRHSFSNTGNEMTSSSTVSGRSVPCAHTVPLPTLTASFTSYVSMALNASQPQAREQHPKIHDNYVFVIVIGVIIDGHLVS